MRFVQFFNGAQEALGSDSVFPLDGRYSLPRCIEEARCQAWRLRQVQRYTHFQIRGGTYSRSHAVTEVLPIERKET